MRRMLALAVLVALPMLGAGCSVPTGGVAGISVDAAGNPIGYLLVCKGHLDGATLHTDGEDDDQGTWSTKRPATGLVRWPLDSPASDWTTETPLGQLRPGVTYGLYGWTDDNSNSAAHVSFTTADLARLEPGQILYTDHDDRPALTTEQAFRDDACHLTD